MRLLVGVFVGGRGRRMGNVAKGLLPTAKDGQSVIERTLDLVQRAYAEPRVVLVGRHEAYAHLSLSVLEDTARDSGPLAGLVALLEEAGRTDAVAVALACDMPHLSVETLRRLVDTRPDAAAVAPFWEGKWQPLVARYAPAPCLALAANLLRGEEHGVWRVLDALGPGAVGLDVPPGELLDWDEPADLPTSHKH